MYHCDVCNKDITEENTENNFYIKIFNQKNHNAFNGEEPIIFYYCSWECLDKFINLER